MDHIAKSFQHYHVSIINSKIHLSTWRKISVIKKFIKINNFKPYIKFLHNTLVTHKVCFQNLKTKSKLFTIC